MCCLVDVFFFKQKTAYEMRISDWISDVCSSDLGARESLFLDQSGEAPVASPVLPAPTPEIGSGGALSPPALKAGIGFAPRTEDGRVTGLLVQPQGDGSVFRAAGLRPGDVVRSEIGRAHV